MSVRKLDHMNVDTTVQEKAIAFPADARLYLRIPERLVVAAEQRVIKLRQRYRKVGKKALIIQGRYSHARQMKQAAKAAYCDQGYRWDRVESETAGKVVGRLAKRATRTTRNWMKRRAAIEPVIGHLKSDHRLSRNHLKGYTRNKANVVLAAAGYNPAKLLAWFYCAWLRVVMVKKPPDGGSYSYTEHPVRNIILMASVRPCGVCAVG